MLGGALLANTVAVVCNVVSLCVTGEVWFVDFSSVVLSMANFDMASPNGDSGSTAVLAAAEGVCCLSLAGENDGVGVGVGVGAVVASGLGVPGLYCFGVAVGDGDDSVCSFILALRSFRSVRSSGVSPSRRFVVSAFLSTAGTPGTNIWVCHEMSCCLGGPSKRGGAVRGAGAWKGGG